MSEAQSLPVAKSATDIEEILKEIEFTFNARTTPEYKLGADEKAAEIIKTIFCDMEDFQTGIIRAAEMFCQVAKKMMPGLVVDELRIGIDSSSSLPVALMIIDKESEELVGSLMDIARQLESYIYFHDNFEVYIWTLVNNSSLEKELLVSDFPLYREFID
jgi:hypothetical protein